MNRIYAFYIIHFVVHVKIFFCNLYYILVCFVSTQYNFNCFLTVGQLLFFFTDHFIFGLVLTLVT